jgi:PRC-barrel domain
MSVTRVARVVGIASVLVAAPILTATAQTQAPPPAPTTPPGATKPDTTAPPAAPQAAPSASPADKKAAVPVDTSKLVGLSAKSSDGHNLGTIQSVKGPGGKTGIGVKVGGFLGIGGHIVEIPDGKFNRVGDTVQVNMTADEVNKLPKAT